MVDRCVSCGGIVPEGRQVCPKCEHFRVNPCFGCNDRHAECHCYCKKYADWWLWNEKRKESLAKERDESEYHIKRTKQKLNVMIRKGVFDK